MSKIEIDIYNRDKKIYDLEKYDIAKVDDILILVLQLNCMNIIYKFSIDEKASSYDFIESTIREELSKAESYLYEYNVRSYIKVGEREFSGIRIDEISI